MTHLRSDRPTGVREATGRMGELSNQVKALRERIRQGGGRVESDAQHEAGKLTARERVGFLLDTTEPTVELGLFVGHSADDDASPAAGVITTVGRVGGRGVVIVANDATVDHGAWTSHTVAKILRAQEVAMRCRIPIVYLVDSEGLRAPVRSGVFPGQYGAGRVLYYAAVMRRHLAVPQLAALMGPSVGSAAYLPALADVIVMVEGTSFLGLGSPELVKRSTGHEVSAEELGGASVHTRASGVAHYSVGSDAACLEKLRDLIGELPARVRERRVATPPTRLSYELYDLVPDDHRQPYDARAVLECIMDGDPLDEFQADHAPELICGTGFVEGERVGVLANGRGLLRPAGGGPTRFGGLLYEESARKAAYFIETMNRHRTPLLFVQDVAGFMIGPEAEHAGTIRAGAEMVEAMATATVPKIVLTLNHASGAGHYAMGGQGFDPDFVVSLPTGRLGVGDAGGDGQDADAREAAAHGFVDEILLPEELRPALGLLLSVTRANAGPHVGPFQIP